MQLMKQVNDLKDKTLARRSSTTENFVAVAQSVEVNTELVHPGDVVPLLITYKLMHFKNFIENSSGLGSFPTR